MTGVAVLALLGAAACAKSGGSPSSSDSSGPVKVGALLSLKGAYGAVGVPERDALQLAVDQINKAGGILGHKIGLTVYDDEGAQATAQQLAQRLVDSDHVQMAIGPGITALASVASPVFEKNKVLNFALTAQASLWQGQQYIWSSVPVDDLMAEAMVSYAKTHANGGKVAAAYSGVQYGVHGNDLVKAALTKNSMTPAADEKWSDQDINFTPVVDRLVAGHPSAIILWGSGAPADAQMVKALRQGGYTGLLVGNTAYVNQQLVSIAGPAADSFVGVSLIPWGNPQGDVKAFIDAYQQRFGRLPTAQAAYSYDAIYRYKAAAEKARSTDPAKVAQALGNGLDFTSIQGTFHIDSQNHVGADSPDIYKAITVKSGSWTPAP